ncbi:hypothetical protein RMQ97_15500, partial [Maricaulis sp. D1M11]
ATIGDTSPLAPVPKAQKNGCGAVGTIIMVAIAAVVVAATGGALAGGVASVMNGGGFLAGAQAGLGASLSVGAAAGAKVGVAAALAGGATTAAVTGVGVATAIGAAAAGALGSIISQGVGVATGIQEKFSWNAVAMAGLQAGISTGVDRVFGNARHARAAAAGERAARNTTQALTGPSQLLSSSEIKALANIDRLNAVAEASSRTFVGAAAQA